ncbi:unnamed protein product [Hermetia illucens]|uniref:Uncharacterized protein n=1 Tax=Hermetia illucens TaxID=343691 RepID=A0A7R8UJF6_HERIL|nr:unnamed protein product [Hermetia illucens]
MRERRSVTAVRLMGVIFGLVLFSNYTGLILTSNVFSTEEWSDYNLRLQTYTYIPEVNNIKLTLFTL